MSVSASIEPGRGEYRKTCVPRLLVLGTSLVAFLLVKYVEVNVERVPKFHPGGFESYVKVFAIVGIPSVVWPWTRRAEDTRRTR